MSRNIEMNYKTDTVYEPLYPQTTCDMVIDLLNTDTKSLMGLSTTATGDDAFRELFLAITLDGRALINFTVMGNDGTPCKGVQIESSAFCDSNGNLTPTVETNDEGKVSVFCNNTSVSCSISKYANLSDWSDSYAVTFGEVYDKTITLTRYNFRLFESSGNYKFSPEIVRVDVSCCGGGGGAYATEGRMAGETPHYRYGAGGAGGYSAIQESVSFISNQLYSVVVGQGGSHRSFPAGNGGASSFLSVIAQGGGGATNDDTGGIGNGNGGKCLGYDSNGQAGGRGTGYIYSSLTTTQNIGGGGGGTGSARYDQRYDDPSPRRYGGNGGSPRGGKGGDGYYSGSNSKTINATNGKPGQKYGGGGGAGGLCFDVYNHDIDDVVAGESADGAQGCVAIRMYTQSTLPA